MELRSIPTMLKMVATTQSLAFVSDLSLETTRGLRPIKVRALTNASDIGLATRHDMPLPAASAAFATLLRARAREPRPSSREIAQKPALPRSAPDCLPPDRRQVPRTESDLLGGTPASDMPQNALPGPGRRVAPNAGWWT
jgi:hypothetical protein